MIKKILTSEIDFSPVKAWFSNVNYDDMITLLVLLCAVDLLATIQTVGSGIMKEGNAIANIAFKQYGIFGLILLKSVSTIFAVYLLNLSFVKKPDFTIQALWIVNLVLGFVAIYHSVLIFGIIIG
jgi:hypothetical protein